MFDYMPGFKRLMEKIGQTVGSARPWCQVPRFGVTSLKGNPWLLKP